MTRPIVLGNGEMHVGINGFGQVDDFYYPYVGHENHTVGPETRHRIGVWADGELSWTDSDDWTHSLRYPDSALVGHTVVKNQALGITLEFDDAVDGVDSLLMRNIHIVNSREEARDIRLFMHQAFVIGDSASSADTAQYLPDSHAIVHYRGRRVFVVSGSTEGGSFDQHAVGVFGTDRLEGTWRDAEDGQLSCHGVEHGRVDSTLRFRFEVAPLSSVRAHYWIAAGQSIRQALAIHKQVQAGGIDRRLVLTAKWWKSWLEPVLTIAGGITDNHQRKLLVDSAMIIKAHTDKRGGVMASLDSTVQNYSRDSYAYAWPRVGAYAVWPLIRMGYQDEPLAFFDFCRRGLHPDGYLEHKYQADGAIGSSWHPYHQSEDAASPPIQEDGTALVLFVFAQYYHTHPNDKLLEEYYSGFVVPMANFLAEYIDPSTQLPLPSYDIWEERWQTSTYTTAVTYAALLAAADLADTRQDSASAVKWRAAAGDIYQSAQTKLSEDQAGPLIKGLVQADDGYQSDQTLDVSSVFGSFMFGLFPIDSQAHGRSIDAIKQRFDQSSRIGLPRYEGDAYRRSRDDGPSNLWHVTTLWYAQYCIEAGDWSMVDTILSWVVDHRLQSGVLSEQVHPETGESMPVAPSVWSHAEYITTLLDYLAKRSSRDAST